MKLKKLLLVLALALSCSCSPSTTIDMFVDESKAEIARTYTQRVIDGDLTALIAKLDPSLQSDEVMAQLETLHSHFPHETPEEVTLVGYQENHSNGGVFYNVTYQFAYGSKWLLVNAAWKESANDSRLIRGLNVRVLPDSLQVINAFTFKQAGLWHYLIFAAAILMPAITLFSLVVCIRTKFPRRKWLWIIFILVGFTQLTINWTTGHVGFSPLSFQLFSASAMASGPYAPWVVSISFPLGAVMFWRKRKQLKAAENVST